mmetsp:Transcript_8998/g.10805  ORF Transcript_8998/g.10805 Transcript_8998/m.10805 type:complete len:276 (+) Transcript_8998:9794-10621(+)
MDFTDLHQDNEEEVKIKQEYDEMPPKCVEYLASIMRRGLIVCVRGEIFYTFPMYNAVTGEATHQQPYLLYMSDDCFLPCDCSLSIEATRYHNKDQSGFENNQCWHTWISQSSSRDGILSLPPPVVANQDLYLKLLSGYQPKESKHNCHVYVYVANQESKSDAILTVHSGHVKCSACHNGSKQAQGDAKSCPHAEHIWEYLKHPIDPSIETLSDEMRDVLYIQAIYESNEESHAPTFDPITSTWQYPSLSRTIELEYAKLGIPTSPPPLDLAETKT